jgi:hypothetical protein
MSQIQASSMISTITITIRTFLGFASSMISTIAITIRTFLGFVQSRVPTILPFYLKNPVSRSH